MTFKNKYISAATFFFMSITFSATALTAEYSVIIGFHQQPGQPEQELIRRAGGTVDRVYRLIPAIVAQLSEQAMAELREHPLVAYVEEDQVVTTIELPYIAMIQKPFSIESFAEDSEYQDAWGVQHIDSKVAHDKGITGKEIKVAVIDTGIDYNHEDLDANYRGGYDFIYDDDDPMDDSWNSHGTHIAGIIGAEANGTGVVGVAPEVSLYAVKALDGGGFGTLGTIVASIQWAVENDMDIINLSLAGIDSQILQEACDAAYAAGVLIIAAAGNTFGAAAAFPGAYDSVIAVTGTDPADQRGFYTPIDPAIELAAPGLGIRSTAQYNGYIEQSGTSQSAAHVTGTAALVMAAGVGDVNSDGVIDNRDVRQQLQMTAIDLGKPGRDEEYGFGLVDVSEATTFPSVTSISLVREPTWSDSLKTTTLEDTFYQITLENDSLDAVLLLVVENDRLRMDLMAVHIFNSPGEDYPQQVSFDLDATGTTFKLIFVPFGSIGAFADITILN
ncbi:MAG: S8 family peptidase [Gammaproteobacteria bacterium]|nr:S8 family peptidase [Gammaproteobacteria bacterium]MCF6362915.1 S8 family peptidase [Gammaproteobacteria bacterium]